MRILREFWDAVKHTMGNERGIIEWLLGLTAEQLGLGLGAAGLGLSGYQTIAGANQPTGAQQMGGQPWGSMPQLYTPSGASGGEASGGFEMSPFPSGPHQSGQMTPAGGGGLPGLLGISDDLYELFKQYQAYRMSQFSDPSNFTFP